MAGYTYNQNFDALTTGTLVGQDSYVVGAGTVTVVNTTSHTPSQSVLFATTASNSIKRPITAVNTNGSIMYFSLRTDNTAGGGMFTLYLWAGGDGVGRIMDLEVNFTAGTWNLRQEVGTRNTQTGTIVSNTWHNFAVEFDFTGTRVRASLDGAAMGAYITMTAAQTQMNYIWVQGGAAIGTNNFWVDDFRDTPYPVGGVAGANFLMMGV